MDRKLRIAVATTPRTDQTDNVSEWQQWSDSHFGAFGNRCEFMLVCVTPARPSERVSSALTELFARSCGTPGIWAAMEPGAIGPGDTFRGACHFAFAAGADYVVHTPIDVTYLHPHDDDVQDNFHRLLDALIGETQSSPDLVLGDYTPRIWDDERGAARDHVIKILIEQHVQEQLAHYFHDFGAVWATLKPIKRPRSEFFLISRALFRALTKGRRFSPWDPMPQALIYALHSGQSSAVKHVPLGMFYETLPSITVQRIADQVWRTAHQISQEWLRYQSEECGSPRDLIARLEDCQARISGGMDKAAHRLGRILSKRDVEALLQA